MRIDVESAPPVRIAHVQYGGAGEDACDIDAKVDRPPVALDGVDEHVDRSTIGNVERRCPDVLHGSGRGNIRRYDAHALFQHRFDQRSADAARSARDEGDALLKPEPATHAGTASHAAMRCDKIGAISADAAAPVISEWRKGTATPSTKAAWARHRSAVNSGRSL